MDISDPDLPHHHRRRTGIKILAAIAFWIVGRWLIGRVIGLIQAAMNRNTSTRR